MLKIIADSSCDELIQAPIMLSIMIYCFKILRDGKFIHSSVDFSTLKCSSENPPRFFREPSKVLRRTLQGSSENPPRFSGEDSNVLRRRLECSLEKTRMFSGEACTVLLRSVHCSQEKCALFFGHLFKGIFVAKKGFFLHTANS